MRTIMYAATVDNVDGKREVITADYDKARLDRTVDRIRKMEKLVRRLTFGKQKMYDFKTLQVEEFVTLSEVDDE